jgi:predicted CXXCH cytochrome family protein
MKDVCSRCHNLQDAAFRGKHRDFKVSAGSCTDCHDPHGTGKPAMLPAVAHAPYAKNTCNACHTGAQGALAAKPPELCTSCHGEHQQDTKLPFVHAAVATKKACLNCHSPHGGQTKSLLTGQTLEQTCFACHDRGLFQQAVKHPEQSCDTCHDAHGSKTKGILQAPQVELCIGCHDVSKTHAHPYQAPAIDPRDGLPIRCSSCHNPHSSPNEKLLTHDKRRALCTQCHMGPNLEVRGRSSN